jgi:AbrB family looped-hinge helix DNA binding protein
MDSTTVQLGQKGTMVIPAPFRKALGIGDGALLILEIEDGRLVVRPAKAVPIEEYSDQRRAQFILNNAIDRADYERARKRVQQMGLDPDRVPHERPD